MRKPRPLYQSLAVQFSLVAIAPIILIGLLVLWRLVPQINADLSERSRSMAEAVGQQVELFLRPPQVLLESIKADERIMSSIAEDIQRGILDAHVDTGALFEALYLVDPGGRVVEVGLQIDRRAYRDDYLGLDMSGKDFVAQARATGRLTWSDTFLSVVSGRMSVAVALPLRDNVLVGDFIIDRLSEFVARLGIENRVQPIIVDQRGQIIAHPERQLGARQLNISHLDIIKTGLQGGADTRRFQFDNIEYIGSVVSIPGPNWAALISQPLDDAYRNVVTTAQILIMATVLSLVLATLMAILLARRFARPFETLAAHSRIIADGNYSETLPQFRAQEMHDLSRDFSRMVDAIRVREQQLVSGERKYREIFNATNEAIFIHDTETGAVVDVNRTMLEMFHCTYEEALSSSIADFSGDYGFDVGDEALTRIKLAARGSPQVFEWKCKQLDGGRFIAEATLRAVEIDEKPRVLAVVRDITDWKRAQEALRVLNAELEARVEQRTAELTMANQAKSEFLSKMSHELRTPLNAIIGLSEMLLEDAQEDGGNKGLEEPLERVLGAGKHLLVLINDILDLAKVEAGHMELSLEEVELRALLDGVATTIGPLVDQNNNRFVMELPSQDVRMRTDATRLRQILFNLLSNACKFTENGQIKLSVQRKGSWILFEVVDTGIGISKDFLPHLFEEFSQSRAGAVRKHVGTGLGLPICQKLCDVMGGEIYVESREGSGSVFTVRLPLELDLESDVSGAVSIDTGSQGRSRYSDNGGATSG